MRYLCFFLLVVASISTTLAQDTVEFSGYISRHDSVDQNVEVSGNINFVVSGENDLGHQWLDRATIQSLPYIIPAGQSLLYYETTLEWSDADFYDPEHPEYQYGISVEIECATNCEMANARLSGVYLNSHKTGASLSNISSSVFYEEIEIFGLDDRASSYGVDLTLLPGFVEITGSFQLPEGKVAPSDFSMYLIGFDTTCDPFGSGHTYELIKEPINFKKGESHASVNYKYPEGYGFDTFCRPESITNTVALGYSCTAKQCEELGLVSEAWFTSLDGNLTVHPIETVPLSFNAHTSDDSFALLLPTNIGPIKTQSVDIKIARPATSDVSKTISGKIIVSENDILDKIICDHKQDLEINWSEISIQDVNYGCSTPYVNVGQRNVSETVFHIGPNSESDVVEIRIQPQYIQSTKSFASEHPLRPWHIFLYRENTLYNPYQTISFICDEGCDEYPMLEVGYYDEGKFARRSLGAAQKFYLTSNFTDGLNISLIGPPVLTPILELLEDDEGEVFSH